MSQPHEPIQTLFEKQRKAAKAAPFPGYAERRKNLKALKKQLCRYQDVIAVAIARDFGWRAPAESKLIDVMAPVLETSHAIKHLKRWMKPSRRSTELLFTTNSLKVTYQPKGVVGIIVPWNFPFYLAIGPLITALTTGNRAIIKMSSLSLNSAQVMKQLLGEVFDEDLVAVIAGNHPEGHEISKLPFDHIIFTGSSSTGKTIMQNASANLTPVTLELGGKSPAIVSRSYNLQDAAKRIAHNKSLSNGQMCVTSDYAFVPEESVNKFIKETEKAFYKMYGDTHGNEHYTSLVDARHEQKFLELLADARAKGASITVCGNKGYGRQYPLHILTDITDDMLVASEEIFGPLLPVIGYEKIDDVIHYIADRPRPLSCNIFGHDIKERERILKETHTGGTSINDGSWHVVNHDAPFGGIGNSGMGSYHGEEGFRELSHARPVYKRHRFYPIGLFYPPYGTAIQKFVLNFFLGKPDESIKLEAQKPVQPDVSKQDILNIADNLVRTAKQSPDKVAIYFKEKEFTYDELNRFANRVANALRAMGIQPGDKVALSCPNLPYFPMVYYGILKTGAVVVPMNVLFKPAEVAYHLNDSDAKAFFCFEGTDDLPMGENGWDGFNQVDGCEHFIMITADPSQPAKVGGAATLGLMIKDQSEKTETTQTMPDDTAVILYTSGTTGQPKGAELSHSNIAKNAKGSQILTRLTTDDTHLITLPLFHSFGQSVQMNASVLTGASMVLIPRFDAGVVLESLEKHRVSIFAGVPTMYIGLLNYPDANKFDLKLIAKNLRLAASGGASLPVEVIEQFEKQFDVPILEGYGLSETSPVATFNHLEFDRIPGSIGQAIEGVEVNIINADGAEANVDEPGEVVIKGHNVMKGYYKRPEATAEVMNNGWFHTGDIGKKDENGNIYIVDRLKEMIIRGGYNIYPREIEEVLMGHQSVTMVAVIGKPHDIHGEEIKAYVVVKDNFNDADSLKSWCKERMADYKYPREIEFRDELPMTATGKILKKELKAELLSSQ